MNSTCPIFVLHVLCLNLSAVNGGLTIVRVVINRLSANRFSILKSYLILKFSILKMNRLCQANDKAAM